MDRIKIILRVVYLWASRDPVTVLFCIVFFIAWTANALRVAAFAMADLNGMYATVKGSDLVKHWTDSKLNSPAGVSPGVNGGKTNG